MRDPRAFQISVLSGLLVYGLTVLEFQQSWISVLALILSAVSTQLLCSALRAESVDLRSALITALSLGLLLRSSGLGVDLAVGAFAIASKYVIRWRGKHLFNPSALALGVALLSGEAWLSSGQWGSAAWLAGTIACLGALVIQRAERSDVTWAFLLIYAGLLFGRALWLGDPLRIPLYSLQNGALLLFAFFMLSDPRTSPASRPGRVLFAAVVACAAFVSHYLLYEPNGAIAALLAASALVPFLDARLPGERFEWSNNKETSHASTSHGSLPGAGGLALPG